MSSRAGCPTLVAMDTERCPECGRLGAALKKTCANEACGNEFRTGPKGRPAIYCSRACAQAQYQRERRRRVKENA